MARTKESELNSAKKKKIVLPKRHQAKTKTSRSYVSSARCTKFIRLAGFLTKSTEAREMLATAHRDALRMLVSCCVDLSKKRINARHAERAIKATFNLTMPAERKIKHKRKKVEAVDM